MAAVTAAVVAGVATVAATGMQVAGGMAGGGGGGSKQPEIKKLPEDPQDEAMKNYYARALVANATKQYPAFSEYLKSGGAAEKAAFPLEMPGMKPSEAAALGFVGTRGEPIPSATPESIAAQGGRLTPEQSIYLAQERRRKAVEAGQKPGAWAGKVGQVGKRLERVGGRIETLEAMPTRLPGQETQLERLRARQERLTSRQERLLSGKGG